MSSYCYSCGCGCDQVLQYPIGTAPQYVDCPCGGAADRNYQMENAAPASAQIAAGQKYPYVSNRLSSNVGGCQLTDKGRPVIESQSHEREVMARANMRRD